MLGGLFVGTLLSEAGEDLLTRRFGHTWPVVVGPGVLGSLAGAVNGWWTWPRAAAMTADAPGQGDTDH